MKVWRIEKHKRIGTAPSGEGARITGGRWNSPGRPVVYASAHLSLAVLEILVHAPDPTQRQVLRAASEISIPDSRVETLPPKAVPAEFGPGTAYTVTQAIGDEWLSSQRTPMLLVPSAIIPSESNALLNPLHPDFAACTWGEFASIRLDPRLWAVP